MLKQIFQSQTCSVLVPEDSVEVWKLIFLQCWRNYAFASSLIATTWRSFFCRYFHFLLDWHVVFLTSFIILHGDHWFYLVHFLSELDFQDCWNVPEVKVFVQYYYASRRMFKFLPWGSCDRLLQVNPDVNKYVFAWRRDYLFIVCSASCRNCIVHMTASGSWIFLFVCFVYLC